MQFHFSTKNYSQKKFPSTLNNLKKLISILEMFHSVVFTTSHNFIKFKISRENAIKNL